MTTHYTAVVEVNKTTHTPPPPAPTYRDNRAIAAAPTTGPSRDVAEVARLVIRADSLKGLADKLVAHVALLAEDGTE